MRSGYFSGTETLSCSSLTSPFGEFPVAILLPKSSVATALDINTSSNLFIFKLIIVRFWMGLGMDIGLSVEAQFRESPVGLIVVPRSRIGVGALRRDRPLAREDASASPTSPIERVFVMLLLGLRPIRRSAESLPRRPLRPGMLPPRAFPAREEGRRRAV